MYEIDKKNLIVKEPAVHEDAQIEKLNEGPKSKLTTLNIWSMRIIA